MSEAFTPTPKRTPGKHRRHASNWGVVNEVGHWASAAGIVAAFSTRACAQSWIDDPAGFGKDAITWDRIDDAEWLGQQGSRENGKDILDLDEIPPPAAMP